MHIGYDSGSNRSQGGDQFDSIGVLTEIPEIGGIGEDQHENSDFSD